MMQTSWLVAMGIDLPNPEGDGTRTVLGHRLLMALHPGPKSLRELHAATGRRATAAAIRAALEELRVTGLIARQVTRSGRQGGRPRETWRLLYPGSGAVTIARQAVNAARSRPAKSRPAAAAGTLPKAGADSSGRDSASQRRRRRRPVPAAVGDAICHWISRGRFLRDFCRRPGRPSTRTVYAWTAKDPEFRRRFEQARDFGEQWIRDEYAEHFLAPSAIDAMLTRSGRSAFHRQFIRPIDLRLQRWRRHPPRP